MSNILKPAMNYILGLFDESRNFSSISYSQEGEDLILLSLIGEKKNGFFVDVGAYHPFKFSNTYLFYKKGWKGINIDATPGSMKIFDKSRPNDINIQAAISNRIRSQKYFIFDENALNGFSETLSKRRDLNTGYKIKKVVRLKPRKLAQILDKRLPPKTDIDFMSLDIEGREYDVLLSNNWAKYRPNYLAVEILHRNSMNINKNRISIFLKRNYYSPVAMTNRTVIFKKLR